MDAEQLIAEVTDTIQDPSYDSDYFLAQLNNGQMAIANRLLLPDLANGHDTVTTVAGSYTVALPTDYNKGLFLAMFAGEPVNVFKDIKSISSRFGGISLDDGDVTGVAVNSRMLVYQQVPVDQSDIELFYYRKPVPMIESSLSHPDGLTDNDALDQALIHYACWKLFAKIEQGIEGAKVDTGYHKSMFEDKVEELDLYCYREGKSYPEPTLNKVHWP